MGVKLAALKAYQRIILVQTRATDTADLSAGKNSADANVGQVPPNHPALRPAALEKEANERLTQIVTVIFTSSNADLVMASMNCLALLAKMRPSLCPIVFQALISWTPSALISLPYMTVRSAEKTLRLLYQHFHPSRSSIAAPYASQIIEALDGQKLRMDTAAREEEERKHRERDRLREISATLGIKRPSNEDNSAAGVTTRRKRVRFADVDDEDGDRTATPTPLAQSSYPQDLAASIRSIASGSQEQYLPADSGDSMKLAHPNTSNPMAAFDVTTLPLHLVIELIVANLHAVDGSHLHREIEQARYRVNGQTHPISRDTRNEESSAPLVNEPALKTEVKHEKSFDTAETQQDQENAQNPLQLDIDEEETLEAAEMSLQERDAIDHDDVAPNIALSDFTLKPPGELGEIECRDLMHASIGRICKSGSRGVGISDSEVQDANGRPIAPAQLWTILVTRLATRGLDGHQAMDTESTQEGAIALRSQSDNIRQLMVDFVAADLVNRLDFATYWMAEEFYCDIRSKRQGRLRDGEETSSIWLQRLTEAIIARMDSKDKNLHELLSRVPFLPDGIISTLQTLCLDKVKMAAGFTILRDLAIHRVPVREKACSILLGLARNEEKMVRGAAIITVRNWVRVNGQGRSPVGDKIEEKVLEYAKDGLRRLTVRSNEEVNGSGDVTDDQNHDSEKLNGQAHDTEDESHTPERPVSVLDDPNAEITSESDVVRLVELPFALCIRVGDMLDVIFQIYIDLPKQIQPIVEKHIQPLIRNLGPNNAKLISLIQDHPPESESLAICIYSVMTEKQRSKKVVELVKEMASYKSDIDARYLIPILPDVEKADIIRFLPRVISILQSEKAEDRATIKSVFTSIVTPPEQGFGSVSTNLPRVRQSELLSPVELMSLLHHADKDVGLKTAAEAIRICFGMTEIFRSEVLGAVLNQLVEETTLPVLFMRTAIMAVRTYKSLSSYISTIFLSRLITKKVWQHPLLWDGFVLCAKQTAPASFGALVQLPRDQLRDVVQRQPDLRIGLREYLVKKAGGHRGRLKAFLELLGEEDNADAQDTPGSGTSTPQNTSTPEPQ